MLDRLSRKYRIAIMDQKTVPVIAKQELAELLDGSLGSRMLGNVAMQDSSRPIFHRDEDVDDAKRRRDRTGRNHRKGRLSNDCE